jgi:hypothetical protein
VNSNELAIIVEDDVDLSPFAYRWVRLHHEHHGHKPFISGYSLLDNAIVVENGINKGKEIYTVRKDILQYFPAYFYRIAFPWGLAPHPARWREFQDWFHNEAKNVTQPYVKEAGMKMHWYQIMEKRKIAQTMWTMWFIYFEHMRQLSAIVSHVPQYVGLKNASLSCHRKEIGLHFRQLSQIVRCDGLLMTTWQTAFVAKALQLPLIDYDGTFIRML